MGLIKFEGREYDFDWQSILMFAVCAPLFTVIFFYFFDWVWLHEITAKITIYTLNFLTGAENEVIRVNDTFEPIEPWRLIIYLKEDGTRLPTITFTKMCTGIHAVLMFVFVTFFTPHSKIRETTKDIWPRKIKAIIITSLLFYIVNIMRMWLQLYLYSVGYEWEDIHYSISAASSFIAIAAIIIIHKFVPEFIMSLLWIGDEIKAKMQDKNLKSENKKDNEVQSEKKDKKPKTNSEETNENVEQKDA